MELFAVGIILLAVVGGIILFAVAALLSLIVDVLKVVWSHFRTLLRARLGRSK